ncbi:potassium channel family protein [Calorimonas adulescens]|jgi:TrkA-N domain./TrkA-C domain.|uniref:TrkA family potassium uptake protein n=1 Tax=Calorimonas adulescens TaxID=2606906 RepID=A0A5D8QE54_9THEO|nr:TrkA family potassium uptake protein [Calorimonas adulescens]TZE82791.1 TrkA family potassium uptake protein [Calorimonas adulescens]
MKQFGVIGLGRFGFSVATSLYEMGYDVLAVDIDEQIVQDISDRVTHAVQADATDENIIRSLGIRNLDVVIVTIGSNIQASIMVTMIVKELGVKFVVAKAQSDLHAKVLYKVGADRVVFPERDMGIRVARNLVSSKVLDYIELSKDYSIVEIEPMIEWIGLSLKEIGIRQNHGLNVVAVRKNKEDIVVSPGPEYVINEDDILVVIGENRNLRKFEKKDEGE